jgi:hypothetical protein
MASAAADPARLAALAPSRSASGACVPLTISTSWPVREFLPSVMPRLPGLDARRSGTWLRSRSSRRACRHVTMACWPSCWWKQWPPTITVGSTVAAVARQARQDSVSGTGVVDALCRCGYEPAQRADGDIELRNCPFHQLARQYPELVCSLNLQLIQSMLEANRDQPERAVLRRANADAVSSPQRK